eukprot:TRINITY_DN393_c0_g1_i1.p1 TRINITY_DN393_c0_g1~~TRINITY_DN393_c0_g1_i1.p1  ORF type:complete len:511 (+),score=27.68 TRINITY_DN393_c0_g1_i1:78-1610(+)
MNFALLGILLLISPIASQFSSQQKLNTTLLFPNITNFPGNFYAGYVNVTNGRQFYYWVYQNKNLTLDAPTIMWMNGGPGCSSLGGATSEVGPVIMSSMVNTSGTYPYWVNEFSWNSIGNQIFIEFPAGVGFSTKPDNLPQNDYTTAVDNRMALQQIFDSFQLWTNDFYILGESYAGVYVPSLAYEIDQFNSNPQNTKKFPLKGFSTGNGCTHPAFQCQMQNQQQWPQLRQLYEQGKVSEDMFQNYMETCFLNGDITAGQNTDDCYTLMNTILQSAGCNYNANPPFINWYDIYRACEPENNNGVKQHQYDQARFRKNLLKNQTRNNGSQANNFTINPDSPCVDNTALHNFLNNRSLWSALNVNSSNYKSDFVWHDCAEDISFTITNGSYWIYQQLVGKGYKIFIYSGNTDLCVPIPGTRKWISLLRQDLGLNLIEPMRPWYIAGNTTAQPQLAGFVESYEGLTFVEVQGVGHMVPQWARGAALQMVTSLVTGQEFPTYDSLASTNQMQEEL